MFVIAQSIRGWVSNIPASVHRLRPNFGERKMKSILDHKFHYTSSVETDVKKTFARVRRELGVRGLRPRVGRGLRVRRRVWLRVVRARRYGSGVLGRSRLPGG